MTSFWVITIPESWSKYKTLGEHFFAPRYPCAKIFQMASTLRMRTLTWSWLVREVKCEMLSAKSLVLCSRTFFNADLLSPEICLLRSFSIKAISSIACKKTRIVLDSSHIFHGEPPQKNRTSDAWPTT